MAQQLIYGKEFVEDFAAQTAVPLPPPNYARLYYNGTALVCFDSAGNQLIGSGGGGGTVTSVLGTANQITSDGSTTTPTLSIPSTFTFPGTVTNNLSIFGATTSAQLAGIISDETGTGALVFAGSPTFTGTITGANETLSGTWTATGNGALSQAALTMTGVPITGGSGTTTYPYMYFKASGATDPTTWNTSGTTLGINAPSGFGGNLVDFHVNGGTSVFRVAASGTVVSSNSYTAGGTSQYNFASSTRIVNNADGVLALQNTAQTDFGRLQFGGTTSSFPSIKRSGTLLNFRLADDSGDSGIITATELITAGNAASTSSLSVTGAPFTGGTATTTFPLVYLNNGAAVSSFNTSGTFLGFNGPSGFAGLYIDVHTNGTGSIFTVGAAGATACGVLNSSSTITAVSSITSSSGSVFSAAGGLVAWSGRTKMAAPSDGVLELLNNAQTDFSRLQFGGTTSAFPALKRSASVLQFDLADDSALTYFNWGGQTRVTTQFDSTSTTLATVTGLSVSVVAGRTYTFEALLNGTLSAAGGLKVAIAGTATATSIIYQVEVLDNTTSTFATGGTSRQTALGGTHTVAAGPTSVFARISGTITVNAAGTLLVQGAQATASGTSSVLVGSSFTAYDCP